MIAIVAGGFAGLALAAIYRAAALVGRAESIPFICASVVRHGVGSGHPQTAGAVRECDQTQARLAIDALRKRAALGIAVAAVSSATAGLVAIV